MTRYSLIQLFTGTALVAILLAFTQTEGCGRRITLIESVSFSSDGSRMVVSKLNARDARTPGKVYKANVSRTISLLASSDGASAGIVHQDFRPGNCGPALGLWRVGRTTVVLNPTNDHVVAVDFGGGGITHYDPTPQAIPIVTALQHPAFNIAVAQSGQLLAASGPDHLTVFDTTTTKVVMRAQADGFPFLSAALIAFSDDETRLVVASHAGVHVWEVALGTQSSTALQGIEPRIMAIATAPNNTLLACSNDGVRRYDFSGNVVSTLPDTRDCRTCSVSADGQLVALLQKGNLLIHDLTSGARLHSVRLGSATTLSFSPDGKSLAVGGYDGKVLLIDVRTGDRLWSSTPPGRHRWPWTLPVCFLAVWAFVVWRLSKKSRGRVTQHESANGLRDAMSASPSTTLSEGKKRPR